MNVILNYSGIFDALDFKVWLKLCLWWKQSQLTTSSPQLFSQLSSTLSSWLLSTDGLCYFASHKPWNKYVSGPKKSHAARDMRFFSFPRCQLCSWSCPAAGRLPCSYGCPAINSWPEVEMELPTIISSGFPVPSGANNGKYYIYIYYIIIIYNIILYI